MSTTKGDVARGEPAVSASDRRLLRDLAKRYVEVAEKPVQEQRRAWWRELNSLNPERPLIYTRAFAWQEMPESRCACQSPFLRHYESTLREALFRDTFDDDYIIEPWVTVSAVHRCQGWGTTGIRHYSEEPRGSWKMEYALQQLADVQKLRAPWHEIDELETARRVERLAEVIGDIITINVDRGPAYRMWQGDVSTDLGYLRGIEHFMLDMTDNPEWLHGVVGFMRDGILRTHEQAEEAGDWGLCCHQNQAMPYAKELPPPAANVNGVLRSQLWGYMAAQEFALVSPAMHEEFLFRYQLPILSAFGLTAYGCCEDLTKKITMLRQLPNLRRIAVAPAADVAECAEQIGSDYVISYRPSPADMVAFGFDPDRVRAIVGRAIRALRHNGCVFDITLKDVETVQGDPHRVRQWVRIVRELVEE